MREAALRQVQLTVLAVHEVLASYWSGQPVTMLQDEHALATTRESAAEATAKAAVRLGDHQPPSVIVQAVTGFAAQELIHASADSEMLVLGARRRPGPPHPWLGQQQGRPPRVLPGRSSPGVRVSRFITTALALPHGTDAGQRAGLAEWDNDQAPGARQICGK
jgi:hypothetical protein